MTTLPVQTDLQTEPDEGFPAPTELEDHPDFHPTQDTVVAIDE